MNSVEWRLKKIENKLLGTSNASSYHIDRLINQSTEQKSVFDQFTEVSKLYKEHLAKDENYTKFIELYLKFKNLMNENKITNQCDDVSKVELVLAYENHLKKYFDDLRSMSEKADRVLDIKKWPELDGYQTKLEKLQKINLDQLRQSQEIDEKTGKLIEVYNDIIKSFEYNIAIWNSKLEAYEIEEKKADSE